MHVTSQPSATGMALPSTGKCLRFFLPWKLWTWTATLSWMLTADTRLQVRHRELYHQDTASSINSNIFGSVFITQDTASSININIFGSVFFGLQTYRGDVNGPSGCQLSTAVCWTWEHPFLTMGRSMLSLCSRGRYSLCLPRLFTIQLSMTVYPQKRTVNASLTSHVETQEVHGETCPNRQLTWSVVKRRCVRPAVHGVLTWVCHNHNLCHKSGICRYYYQHRVWKTIVYNNFLLVL